MHIVSTNLRKQSVESLNPDQEKLTNLIDEECEIKELAQKTLKRALIQNQNLSEEDQGKTKKRLSIAVIKLNENFDRSRQAAIPYIPNDIVEKNNQNLSTGSIKALTREIDELKNSIRSTRKILKKLENKEKRKSVFQVI